MRQCFNFFSNNCVKILTFASKMPQNGDSFVPKMVGWQKMLKGGGVGTLTRRLARRWGGDGGVGRFFSPASCWVAHLAKAGGR